MNIKPDGSFTFTESKLDFFNMDQYHECVEIFENAKAKSEDVQGILKNSNGEINIIKGTDWITLPELFAIDAELLEGNNRLRGKNKRDELLTSCLDIKCFEQNGDTYYFVGEIGEGMRNSISHSTNIRQIVRYKDAPDFFEQLLPLMSVSFVKNGQLTVIPFPYKYLREYIKTVK
jgi:glutaredoxin-related protein